MNPLSGLPNHTRIILLFLLAFFLIAVPLTSYTLSKNESAIVKASPTPKSTPDPSANWKTYTNSKYGLSLKHPNLNMTCCNLSSPLFNQGESLGTFADETTTTAQTDKPFNGFALYVDTIGGESFEEYISQQKRDILNRSKDDPFSPQNLKISPSEETTIVVEQKGITLKNYAYLNDYTYVPFPSSKNVLIIVKSDPTGNFKNTFDQILATFKFTSQTISDREKQQIDNWITKNNLNTYGDPMDTMYTGGTPLFNEATGERTDRYIYISKQHPNRPWCTPRPACLDSTPRCLIAESIDMCPTR